ncbi:AzlC family ABC transporter permease [Acinetobacter puyangensis]|uniref:AzlC family ABC transporter permease n=1 Tax=Acinetobacter puyangensis TaxID=1096779 RepID=UPI003A4DA343
MNSHILSSPGTFWDGAKDALVIVFTYLPVSFAFGVGAVSYGFSPWEALFLSSTMYAGASQFLVIALLASGSSIWLAAITVIALDIRHVLYGPALYQNIPKPLHLKKTAIWAWGLTDEVFARGLIELSQRKQHWSESWMLGLSLTAWASWALGSLLGGLFANKIQHLPKFLQASLDFLLPALFLSFLLAAFERKQKYVIAVALIVSAFGCIFVGLSFAIFIGIIAGMLTAIMQYQYHKRIPHAS